MTISLLCTLGCRREHPHPPSTTPRIISTAPNLTEIIYAVGASSNLVGRTQVCNFPPHAATIPITCGFGTPWLEPLILAQPTHVLVTALSNPSIKTTISRLNIEVTTLACDQVADIPPVMRQIAHICNTSYSAEPTIRLLEDGIATARQQAPHHFNPPPRVLLLLAPDQPITAGGATFISELLHLAGATNIADTTASYYRFSHEWLLQASPDLIICCYETTPDYQQQLLSHNPLWHSLKAIRQNRVYPVKELDLISRPGPRLLLGIREFHRILTHDS